MIRPLIGLLGVLTALLPDRIIDVFETALIESPGEYPTRAWISSGIRIEGVVVAIASLTGGRAYAWMMNLTGVFGGVLLLSPRLYRRFATELLYEEPERITWNDQFTKILRTIGFVYVFLAARAFNQRRDGE